MLRAIKTPGVSIVITYEGHPEGVLMSFDEFEGWMETMDIMSNPTEVAAIEEGMRQKERGEVVTLKEFKKKLGGKKQGRGRKNRNLRKRRI